MADRAPYRPGQRVVWIGREHRETGRSGQPLCIRAGDVGTVVGDDWPIDFVVSFPEVTFCCDPADVRAWDFGRGMRRRQHAMDRVLQVNLKGRVRVSLSSQLPLQENLNDAAPQRRR